VRLARLAIAFLVLAWVALLLAAPSAAFGVPASGLVYACSSFICHQRPERSFHLAGAQLPVCARCFGLYFGAAIGVLCALSVRSSRLRSVRQIVVLAAMPTAFTWLAEFAGAWAPSNATRFAAALPLGAAVALTVNYLECARPPRNRSIARRTPT
jgi:uncharacterized membrane protein